jgi:hypothetical protein
MGIINLDVEVGGISPVDYIIRTVFDYPGLLYDCRYKATKKIRIDAIMHPY